MSVEIDSILQYDDVQVLLETAESSGTVRQSELTDVMDVHEFDVFDQDLLFRELETRGVEIVDDTREVEKAPPPPPPPAPTVESTAQMNFTFRGPPRTELIAVWSAGMWLLSIQN